MTLRPKVSKTRVFSIILLFSTFTAKAQTADQSNQAIETVLKVTFHDPLLTNPSNKKQVDSLYRLASKTDDKRLLAYLQLFLLNTKSLKSDAPKVNFLQESDKIAENSAYLDVKGFHYYYKGLVLSNRNESAKGLPYFFQAKKILEEAHYDSFPFASFYYQGFAGVYYNFENFKMAAYYYQNALKKPASEINLYPAIYNNLGLCYLKLKDFEKADKAFKAGIEVSKKTRQYNYEAMIKGNLGNLLRLSGNPKAALPYLYEEAKVNEKAVPENAAISRMYIANSLLQLDSVAKAATFMKPPNFKMPIWSFPSYDLIRFETLALYHSKIGNYQWANHYKDSLIALKDTLKIRLDYKKITVLESSLQAEKYMNERKSMEERASYERLIRNLIIVCLVLLLSGILYWFNQRRQKANQMLVDANKELNQYLHQIKEKNDLIEHISSQLQQTKLAIAEEDKNAYLENLQKSVILTDANWEEFKAIFERIFPQFFRHLNNNHPDLTPAEVRLLALEKLSIPDKEMGNMLGVSADSVRKTRYRLRKKHPELLGKKEDKEG